MLPSPPRPFLFQLFTATLLLGRVRADVGHSEGCRWERDGPLDASRLDDEHSQCQKPVDDVSTAWKPWNHRPACAHPEAGGPSRYCVYTYNALRGSSGISLLATPQVAAGLAPYLDDPDPAWLHPQAQLYHVTSEGGESPYEVRDIPGKGKGAVAIRQILAGEVILRETPTIMNIPELPQGVVPSQVGEMFDLALDQLPDRDRNRVLEMARSKGSGNILDDILNTNSFGVKVNDQFLSALCPEIARLNHACRPNVFTRFLSETLTMEAVAYADIASGEELTISYLPLNLLSEQRKSMIQKWHFNCTCSICTLPELEVDSDRNKLRIQGVLDELKEVKDRNREKVESLARELMRLLEVERLQAQAGSFASILAGVYFNLGDLEKAREYAADAVANNTHFIGYNSDKAVAAMEMVELLDSIEYE